MSAYGRYTVEFQGPEANPLDGRTSKRSRGSTTRRKTVLAKSPGDACQRVFDEEGGHAHRRVGRML